MTRQNRVDPFGDIVATAARGTLMGNRGGRIHRDNKTLGPRRFASRQWICCALDFNGRQREVWSANSYTELFFLDEPVALAAGHRPCFECRRRDAQKFAALFGGKAAPARAAEMDNALHAERLDGAAKRVHRLPIDSLPDAAFLTLDGAVYAVRGSQLLRWTPSGYCERKRRPRGAIVAVLTPPSIVKVCQRGYQPRWHKSAG